MSGTPPRVSEAGREKCAVRGSREAERGKQQGLVGVRCSQRAPEYIQQGSPGAYTSPRGPGANRGSGRRRRYRQQQLHGSSS